MKMVRHRGDDRRRVDSDGERHDLEVFERLAIVTELKLSGHETGLLELGEVHVQKRAGHPHTPGEFADMESLPRQQCDYAHPLVAGDGSQRCAESFDCRCLLHAHPLTLHL
jgi:hypothetical protein